MTMLTNFIKCFSDYARNYSCVTVTGNQETSENGILITSAVNYFAKWIDI